MGSDRTGWRARVRQEHGNALVLFPAAVLILLGLGGLALDAATVFLGQRRLADLAASVANDAIAAVDEQTFYGVSDVALTQERIAARQLELIAAQPQDRGFESIACDVEVVAGEAARATVACTAEVRPIFAPFVPGMGGVEQVRIVETAFPVRR